ncbi:MAG: hypothetical protein PUA53_00235 [Chlamydia suis]|uniref:hypothetical protein n=1 Tax=Chlamydia suis TaxID=83559 RepID=UPI0009B03A33|nr:hypothetical protein [Chlamydia suis]MDD6309452.1 hypothetical protein [Chlamydia suis]
MKFTVAVFGEAEKGSFDAGYLCSSLTDLHTNLGHGRDSPSGISLAVRAIMQGYNILFFRVKEEGFFIDSYFFGLHFLSTQSPPTNIIALALPGVGDYNIIEASLALCRRLKSILLFSDQDLYDFLTFKDS